MKKLTQSHAASEDSQDSNAGKGLNTTQYPSVVGTDSLLDGWMKWINEWTRNILWESQGREGWEEISKEAKKILCTSEC